jgi:hypothetical protein
MTVHCIHCNTENNAFGGQCTNCRQALPPPPPFNPPPFTEVPRPIVPTPPPPMTARPAYGAPIRPEPTRNPPFRPVPRPTNPPFPQEPIPSPVPPYELEVTEKSGVAQRYSFTTKELSIGRVQGNNIVLPSGKVSKQHARVIHVDGRFVVVDLKSTAGVYVNGRKITSPQVISAQDKIYIGDFMLQLVPPNTASPQYKTCPNCNSQQQAHVSFCLECGKDLRPFMSPPIISRIEPLASPANTLNHQVFVGNAFAFISPKLAERPDLRWMVSLFGPEAATPKVIPLLGEEVLLPGVKARSNLEFVRNSAVAVPDMGSTPIYGTFLQAGASSQRPFTIERLENNRARITPNQEVAAVSIIALDRDFPMKRADAVDIQTAQHPQTADRLYQTAEKFFEQGQISMAKALYEEARSAVPVPHPFYAYNIACCAARLDEKEEAVRWLKTAICDGWLDMNHLKNDNDLASLRGYPPFDTLGESGQSQPHTTSTTEIELFASTLLLIGAFVDGVPWEAWLVL